MPIYNHTTRAKLGAAAAVLAVVLGTIVLAGTASAGTPKLPDLRPVPSTSVSVDVTGNGSVISRPSRTTQAASKPGRIRCGTSGYFCYSRAAPSGKPVKAEKSVLPKGAAVLPGGVAKAAKPTKQRAGLPAELPLMWHALAKRPT
jgi:hypothetical protein